MNINSENPEVLKRAKSIRAVIRSFRLGELKDKIRKHSYLNLVFCNEAKTNGQTVFLPSELIASEFWDRSLTLGLMVHELGHCSFSDMSNMEYRLYCAMRELYRLCPAFAAKYADEEVFAEEAQEIKCLLASFVNVWEDLRIDFLSSLSFSSGKMLTMYSNEALIQDNLMKMGNTDEAVMQYFKSAPFSRSLGLYCLLLTSVELFDDGKTALSAQRRCCDLLGRFLASKLTQQQIDLITELKDQMLDFCRNQSPLFIINLVDYPFRLAVEIMKIYVDYLMTQQSKLQEGASADQDQNSTQDSSEQQPASNAGSSAGQSDSDAQSDNAEQHSDSDNSGNSGKGAGKSSCGDNPSAQSDSSSDGSQTEKSASGQQSAAQSLLDALASDAAKAEKTLDARQEFLQEQAQKSAEAGYEPIEISAADTYSPDRDCMTNVSGTAVARRDDVDLHCDAKLTDAMLKACSKANANAAARSRTKKYTTLMNEVHWRNAISKEADNRLGKELVKAMRAQSLKTYNRKGKSGFKLARSTVAKVANGQHVAKPFAKKSLCESLSTHVVLLCDSSGSMRDPLSTSGVVRTLSLLSHCFSKIKTDKLKISLYSFADQVMLIKSGCSKELDSSALQGMPCMGGETEGWTAIAAGTDELLKSKCDRKIIVCLTDGYFNSSSLRFDMSELHSAGIESYGIGYGLTLDDLASPIWGLPNFDTWISITDLQSLPQAVSQLFTELVKQSAK